MTFLSFWNGERFICIHFKFITISHRCNTHYYNNSYWTRSFNISCLRYFSYLFYSPLACLLQLLSNLDFHLKKDISHFLSLEHPEIKRFFMQIRWFRLNNFWDIINSIGDIKIVKTFMYICYIANLYCVIHTQFFPV